jgi:hypothetical protein
MTEGRVNNKLGFERGCGVIEYCPDIYLDGETKSAKTSASQLVPRLPEASSKRHYFCADLYMVSLLKRMKS